MSFKHSVFRETMKTDSLKHGEGRKKQEGKGWARKKEVFLLHVETNVMSQEKPFPHDT